VKQGEPIQQRRGTHPKIRMKTIDKKKEKNKEIKAQLLRKLKCFGMGSFELESLETICRIIINNSLK